MNLYTRALPARSAHYSESFAFVLGQRQVKLRRVHARDNEVDVLRAREVANSGVRHVGGLVRCDHVVVCAVHHMYIIA